MRIEERPLVRWVPVVDKGGKSHLEMRWELPTVAQQQVSRAS